MDFRPLPRPIRIVLRWQLIATVGLTLVAAFLWGVNGAISAALGGAVNLVAGWVFGWRAAQGEAGTPGEALRNIFRAEAIKVLLIFAGLWLVLASYKDIVHAAFFASFVVTVAVFAAAIAVRDTGEDKTPRHAGDE
jgi:ATP synthase protein I